MSDVSWPIRTEIECAHRIIKAMAQDIADMEDAIPPSKRGSRFQRALDSLKGRVGAAQQCLRDAEEKIGNSK